MMDGFEFNKKVNPNKIFLIQHSELESRIDPHQYHHERIAAIKAIKRKNKTVHLSQLVNSVKQISKEIGSEDIYIGLENITSNTGEYIATADKQSISSAGVFKKGQILFPKLRPYLNKVYLAEFDGICSTEFHIFEAKNISPEFLAIYLRSDLIVNQTKHLMTGNTLPRLQTEDIQKLPVPLVSSVVQSKIIDVYKKADKQKHQKEQQAHTLLDSIDTYLLKELGITLPEQDSSLEKRIFTTQFSQITGERFDPDVHFTKDFKIEGGNYPNISLYELAYLNKGQSITSKDVITGDYPVIAGGQSSPYSHNTYNYAGNVITVSASGAYAGFVRHHNYAIFASDCTVIQSKDERKLFTIYLFELLKTKQKEIYNLQQGAGQPHVYSRDLMHLKLPIPPIEKQTKIVEYITQIRSQAKQLQIEAAQVMTNAKEEIERIILGSAA